MPDECKVRRPITIQEMTHFESKIELIKVLSGIVKNPVNYSSKTIEEADKKILEIIQSFVSC